MKPESSSTDWSEIDVLGHINNVMINKYMQASRIEFWTNMGVDPQFANLKVEPMVASTSVQFLKQLHFPGEIEVRTGIFKIGSSSYTMQHVLIEENLIDPDFIAQHADGFEEVGDAVQIGAGLHGNGRPVRGV